jgi:IclR family KDG regulon transcriptional repressor
MEQMKSTVKVFAVFETLCKEGPAGVSQLSKRFGLNKSSVHRFLSVLAQLGYVDKNVHTEEYYPTLKMFQLGVHVKSKLSLVSVVRPYTEELNRTFQETVNLALFVKGHAIVIDRVESLEALRSDPGLGRDLPSYCTALGKVFLASLPKEELDRYLLERKLGILTKKTIVSEGRLLKELDKVRKGGYAIDDREFDEGIRCIAVPIRETSGKTLSALSISGPSSRVSLESLTTFKNKLLNVASKISRRLGSQGTETFHQ